MGEAPQGNGARMLMIIAVLTIIALIFIFDRDHEHPIIAAVGVVSNEVEDFVETPTPSTP